jgi:tetratricopeptide (TPR) repeat protein
MSTSDPEVLLESARQDLANGQLALAEAKCLQVLDAQRHHPGALSLLGQVLYSQGRHDEAVRVFNALALMQPTVAEHWRNLGTALRPTRQYDLAIAAFDRALRLAPPTAALLYNLGILQMERSDYNAAYLALRDAVALAPTDGTIRWAFAQCCFELINVDEALAALEDWQKLQGLTAEITVRICFLLVMMGATQQAWPGIERLLANPPQKGRAAVGMASILERLHRLDEARAIVERLDVNDHSLDGNPERLLLAAKLAERAGQREEARRHLSLALESQSEFLYRYRVLFPLAKIQDALGRYEEAFATAEEAHRSQLLFLESVMGKSSEAESRILSRAAHGCDPDDVATWESAGPAIEDSPIFIVGFPRSGTTLLEQVLDAHPLLQSMDEQPFLVRALGEVTDRGIRYPTELGKLTPSDLDTIRAGYWDRVRKKVNLLPGQRLVDKNPLNMVLLPLMRRMFPNAHFILAVRHPCDVLLSCYLQDFRAPELALLCRDLPTLTDAYSRAFEFWYSQAPLLRPLTYELSYEQFAADFATQARKLAEFLQLPWHEAMLAPGEHARAKGFISTPSYTQVLEPVNNRSVGRWKHYESHFAPVLPILKPWIERWAYSL